MTATRPITDRFCVRHVLRASDGGRHQQHVKKEAVILLRVSTELILTEVSQRSLSVR